MIDLRKGAFGILSACVVATAGTLLVDRLTGLETDISLNAAMDSENSRGLTYPVLGVSVKKGNALYYSVKSSSSHTIAGEIVSLDNIQLWSWSREPQEINSGQFRWTNRGPNRLETTNFSYGVHNLSYEVIDTAGRMSKITRPFMVTER